MVGHTPQETGEFACFVAVQGRGEIRFVFVGGALGLGEECVRAVGQGERVSTAVVWMRPALDQLTFLEVVNELDHLVAVQAHGVSQLLLGQAFGAGQMAQELEMACAQPQGREPLGETVSGAESQLGEQESHALAQRAVHGSFGMSGHCMKR